MSYAEMEKLSSSVAFSVNQNLDTQLRRLTQSQCFHCVMDRSAPEIDFDDSGMCNFCHGAQDALHQIAKERHKLWDVVRDIKESRKDKYDCIIGLSGGVDSSTLLHQAVALGLHPLCFTLDNGWNDPKADENIMNLVETLEVPLYRYTIDLPKFKRLQAAFIQAGVKNIEIPTDHVIMAATYELASKYKIKYILSGGNVVTESIMPPSWGHNARDLVHIKAIYKQFAHKSLSGLPVCSTWKWNWYRWIKGIKVVYLLDYLDYNREDAIKTLEAKFAYKPYGEKHCESTFTWWFQNFYLFEKFGIDKRKAHFSSLINSGQMTRAEALEALGGTFEYPKIGLEERAMKYERHEHSDYPMDPWYDRIASVVRKFT